MSKETMNPKLRAFIKLNLTTPESADAKVMVDAITRYVEAKYADIDELGGTWRTPNLTPEIMSEIIELATDSVDEPWTKSEAFRAGVEMPEGISLYPGKHVTRINGISMVQFDRLYIRVIGGLADLSDVSFNRPGFPLLVKIMINGDEFFGKDSIGARAAVIFCQRLFSYMCSEESVVFLNRPKAEFSEMITRQVADLYTVLDSLRPLVIDKGFAIFPGNAEKVEDRLMMAFRIAGIPKPYPYKVTEGRFFYSSSNPGCWSIAHHDTLEMTSDDRKAGLTHTSYVKG